MSSTPISTPTALRRVATVRRPKLKSRAPSTRKCWRPTCNMISPGSGLTGRERRFVVLLQLLARDEHGTDERGEEDERDDLEWEQPPREERVADLAGRGSQLG